MRWVEQNRTLTALLFGEIAPNVHWMGHYVGSRNGTEALEEKKKNFLSNQEIEPHFIGLSAIIPYTIRLWHLGSKVIRRVVIFQLLALAVYDGLNLRSA